jgi:predicted ferric reductase
MSAVARSGAGPVVLWLGLYVAAVTVPLFALLASNVEHVRGWWWDFSMALGYAGLAMLCVQFALTARFRRATAPFGIDIVYRFHRHLALLAVAMLVAHYLILRLHDPAALGPADPRLAPGHMTAGRAALLSFAAVCVLSLGRRALRTDYERWRLLHAGLSTTALALALWHLAGSGHYLDAPWKQALWAAYGSFWLGLIVHVRVLRPWRLAQRPWQVREVRPERGRVCTLVLAPPPGTTMSFAPGQFVWLSLRTSPYAMKEHPFSIASSALRPETIELSIKALGDFSASVAGIRAGETAWVDGPYGTFGVDRHPRARGFVFIAGGIGVAPLMSMLRTLSERGDARPLWLFYGNRAWERVSFREELETLAGRLQLQVVHVLGEPPPGWTGERGLIDADVLRRHLPARLDGLEFLVCGPTAMTVAVERATAALGVPMARVHAELFEWV